MDHLQKLYSPNLSPRLLPRRSPVIVTFLLLFLFLFFNGAVSAASTTLVINEIDYDQPSTDAAEFVEIKNVSTSAIDLSGWSLVLVNGNGNSVYNTIALPAVSLAGGDYFVVCANAATVANCDLDSSPDTNFIQNGAPDAVALFDGGTLIDTVSYEGDTGAPYTEGSGSGLSDSGSIADLSISRFPDGIDTDQNNVDLSRRCVTPGTANSSLELCDAAPAVSSTTPSNGATNVAVDANIDISFSEDVAVTGSWFDITCASSGAHTATVSGGPLTYTLDPGVDLVDPESCTVTIYATQVTDTDTDDPPDNMAGDFVFSFDTGSGAAIPEVVINEIIQNPAAVGDSSGEWFEVYNPTGAGIDMDGWTIKDDGSNIHVVSNGGPLVVPAGGYLVFGRSANSASNGGVTVDYQYSGFFLGNSDDEVVLLDTILNEVDRVEYDGGPNFPDPNGASMALANPALDNNVGANWCTASTPFGDGDLGTPGAANDCPVPEVVINEIIQNPAAVGDSSGEWFEVYNPTGAGIDMDGWTIKDDGSNIHVVSNGGPLVVPAGGYLVFGRSANSASNGGVTVDYQYSGFFLGNSDDEVVLLDTILNEVDRVEYDGGPNFPDPTGASMALAFPGLDNNDGANWCTASTPFGDGDSGTPGAINDCPSAKIHEVQGSGSSVAIPGLVTVDAIVVADYQNSDQLSGFFIQEEDADVDADPLTSEGIFVYCGGCGTGVAVGDLVQVTGLAEEFFAMSQIDMAGSDGAVNVVSSGNVLPTAATIDLPASGSTVAAGTFENAEGMLVRFTDTLYVSEYFQLARFGQIVLTADARPRQFTDANSPSIPGYSDFLVDLSSKRIILDDDNNIQNDALGSTPAQDEPYFWPRSGLSTSNFVRGGDSIGNLTGVLHWSWAGSSGTDAWRVRPVEEAFTYDFDQNNVRSNTPDPVGGSLKVASFNVLNYFTTINSRGADSTAELDRQRTKIAAAICDLDADIVGLVEIENNGSTAIEDLLDGTDGINDNCGPYDYINTGVLGTDQIAVAFIYKTATSSPVGAHAILDNDVDSRFNDDKNRPALAQTFEDTATGGALTVIVNHLKSKGSSCNDVGDPNANDGQGNCNGTRTDAAAAMVDWLATDPTGSNDPDFLIIGDLNAYRNEDPIVAIEEGSDDTATSSDDYTDLLDTFIGSPAYSFVFDGQLGYLDHALANNSLFGQVTAASVWHINADEIPVFDYNDDIQDAGNEQSFERESSALPIFEDNAFRASDHDPVLVGLDLNRPPDCSGAAPSINRLWPPNHQFVDIDIFGVTDPEGDVLTITIDSIFQDEPVSFTDEDNELTFPDGQGVGTSTAAVRAERNDAEDDGNGRYYHITFTAADDFGGSCSNTVQVTVPKKQGNRGAAIDDGALYDSTIE